MLSYLEMGQEHISGDKEISEAQIEEIEKTLNAHCAMLLKVTKMGADWEHEDRHRESNIKHSGYVAPMSLLVKDHKKVEAGKLPKSRPVVSACQGLGTSHSIICSEIIEPLADSLEDGLEVISTEDFISRVEEANLKLAEASPDKVALVGADVKAMFPSLGAETSARIVRNVMMESSLEVSGVDYRSAAMYVRYNYTDAEIRAFGLSRVIPRRRYKQGRAPRITSKEAMSGDSDKTDDKWIFPDIELTKIEERKLVAACLEIGVRTSFQNSVYTFGGRYYLKQSGSPIGERLSMAVSRIVMYDWGRKMKATLTSAGMETYLASAYVDDIRFLVSTIRRDQRWNTETNRLEAGQGTDEDISETRHTALEMKKMMDQINPDLQFDLELEEDFEDMKLPTLDTAIWMSRTEDLAVKINYIFYEKPMNSVYVIHKNSAMDNRSKLTILSQDMIRRLHNTSSKIDQKIKNKIVENYSVKLLRSGYNVAQTRDILISGLRGYKNKVRNAQSRKLPLHRSAKSSLTARYRKKMFGKTSWYKNNNKNKIQKNHKTRKNQKLNENNNMLEVKSVLFVPHTPGSELAKRLRKEEERVSKVAGYRVKIVERTGTQLRRILCKKNPFTGLPCGRERCLSCRNEKTAGQCRRRNITYMMTCDTCNREERKEEVTDAGVVGAQETAAYVGETYRSSYERGREHLASYKARAETSHMWKHHSTKHPEEEGDIDFSMKILKQHKTSFSRQTHEAVMIEMMDQGNILNSKGGFNRCSIPRLGVMVGDKEHEDRGHGGGAPLTDNDVDTVLTKKNRKSGLRERGTSQAPPLKRRRERDRSAEKNTHTNSERMERSWEVERDRDQHQNNFHFSSFKSTQIQTKTCTDKKRPESRTRKATTRHPPKEINTIKKYFTPRRDDPEVRRERTGGG